MSPRPDDTGATLLSPYKGLTPFGEKDEPYFFGRDAEREIIASNLQAARITVVYGASGVGKSSVLRAGVVPVIRRLAQKNIDRGGKARFCVVTFPHLGRRAQAGGYGTWRDHPAIGLGRAVLDAANAYRGDSEPLDPDRLGTLHERIAAASDMVGGTLLIILDQFEEYFLYHAHNTAAGSFAYEFPRIVNDEQLQANYLIGIREDGLAKLDFFKHSIPNLLDNRLEIKHLDESAARDAICKPLARFSKSQEAGGQTFSIEPELVESVLAGVRLGRVAAPQGGRGVVEPAASGAIAGQARIETPYLQLVLNTLWREERVRGSTVLAASTLDRLGNVSGIVDRHFRDSMERLASEEEQDLAAEVFNYLVTPSGAKIAQRADDLAGYAGTDRDTIVAFLEQLSHGENRLLRAIESPGDPDGTRYEIFHDVLAASVLRWQREHDEEKRLHAVEEKARRDQAAALAEAERAKQQALQVQELEQQRELNAEQQRRIDAQTRAHRWKKVALALMSVVIVAVLVGWWFSSEQGRSRELAARAVSAAAVDARRGLDLAIAAAGGWSRAEREVTQALDHALRVPVPRRIPGCGVVPVPGGKALQFVADDRYIAVGCVDKLMFIDPGSGDVKRQVVYKSRVSSGTHLEVSHDGQRAVTWDGEVAYAFDLSRPRPELVRQFDANPFSASRDASFAAGVDEHGNLQVMDLRTFEFRPALALRGRALRDLAIDASASHLAMVTGNGDIEVCELPQCQRRTRANGKAVGGYWSVLFAPRGGLLVASDGARGVRVFRTAPLEPLSRELVFVSEGIGGVEFSDRGDQVLLLGERVLRWSASRPEPELPGHDARGASAFSADFRYAAFAAEGEITVFDFERGRVRAALPSELAVEQLALDRAGNRLAALGRARSTGESAIWIWDLDKVGGAMRFVMRSGYASEPHEVDELAFDSNATVVIGAAKSKPAGAWAWELASEDQRSGRRLVGEVLETDDTTWKDVAIEPERRLVAAATETGRLRIWEMPADASQPAAAQQHPVQFAKKVVEVAFSPDGRWLAVGSSGGGVTLFETRTWQSHRLREEEPGADEGGVRRLSFSRSSDRLVVGLVNRTVELWEVGADPRRLFRFPLRAEHFAFSPDGSLLAVAGNKDGADGAAHYNELQIYQTRGAGGLRSNRHLEISARRLVFSPKGDLLAVGGTCGDVQLIDLAATQERVVRRVHAHERGIRSVIFSHDGDQMLTTSDHKLSYDESCGAAGGRANREYDPANLWDVDGVGNTSDPNLPVRMFREEQPFTRAVFSPDGRYLAIGRTDGVIRVYPLELERLLAEARSRRNALETGAGQ